MYFYNYILGTHFYKWQYCFICNFASYYQIPLHRKCIILYCCQHSELNRLIFCLTQPKLVCFLQIIILIDTVLYFLIGHVLRFCPTVYPCWISLIIICKTITWFLMLYLYPFFFTVSFHSESSIKQSNVTKLHKIRIFFQSLWIFPEKRFLLIANISVIAKISYCTEWHLFLITGTLGLAHLIKLTQ